jgi:phosphatidylserine/phosphatidylglycerophosphate/cardiolipin synthase-like enzyme
LRHESLGKGAATGSGTVVAQVMPSGPDYPATNVQRLVVALVHAAQKRVVITTPYFIPDDPLLVALETAVRRGVEMRSADVFEGEKTRCQDDPVSFSESRLD